MNRIVLIGRLTADPELRTTQSGKAVTDFILAVDRRSKDKTDFIKIVVWNDLAKNCVKYLAKGKQAAVSGRLEIDSYDKNGEKRYIAQVIADEVKFLSPKAAQPEDDAVGDEGLPF